MPKLVNRVDQSNDKRQMPGRLFFVAIIVIGVFLCKTIYRAGTLHQYLQLDQDNNNVNNNCAMPRAKSSQHQPESRLPLSELTNNPPPNSLKCPPLTTPIYDRIVPATNSSKIPKILHISYKSRCIPTEIFADAIQQWKETLPEYSFYLHDDQAVDRFLQQDWPEFPGLHRTMQCIKQKGAMTIDLWRMMIVFEFGGLYTDIDNVPISEFKNGTVISPEDTFFASSDGWNRPIQNVFAMEPKHPIAEFTIQTILTNIYNLDTLRHPKLVFTTGPQAFKTGYQKYLGTKNLNGITYQNDNTLDPGVHHGFLNKQVRKEKKWEWHHPKLWEKISINGTNVTRQQQALGISGLDHWKQLQTTNYIGDDYTCREYLYRLEHGHPIEANWTFAKSYKLKKVLEKDG